MEGFLAQYETSLAATPATATSSTPSPAKIEHKLE
jgi:hypothetical protein